MKTLDLTEILNRHNEKNVLVKHAVYTGTKKSKSVEFQVFDVDGLYTIFLGCMSINVAGKIEARKLALDYDFKPWNF